MAEGVTAAAPLLRLEAIKKSFGPVRALRGVSLEIHAGEVHALIGENGAGKSTLMKVLSGAHDPDSGSVSIAEEPLTLANPLAARRAGIAMIYQELTLAPHLTVEENITLGLEQSRLGFLRGQTAKVSAALELLGHADIDPKQKAGGLTIALQQVVEIARAIVSDAKVVIMDEPTSSLSESDKRSLFHVIRKLREEGLAVIYISHFLDEIEEIADRYTVLRDGESVGSGMIAETDTASLVELMIGRKLDDMYSRPEHTPGDPVLSVQNLSGKAVPRDASFELRRGEIMGIFGLVGAGRTELARCLFGLDPVISGSVELKSGTTIELSGFDPVRALQGGLDYLSENRKDEGLAQNMSITQNMTLSAIGKNARGGFMQLRSEEETSTALAKQLGVRCDRVTQPVSALSGGNQQKVALARMVHHDSDIFFMDEPTRGIDIGSKHEIYELVHDLAKAGKSVIVISSYLPELLGTCHSIAVMHRGQLGEKCPTSEISEHEVMLFATTGKS